MKTLYLTDSSANIIVDPETDFVGSINSEDRYDIRGVYYIEEPMHVVYQSGEIKEELDAKKGELLIVFYNNRFNKYRIDTIRTKQWVANIKNRRAVEQKEAEEWAAKNSQCNCGNQPCNCDPVAVNTPTATPAEKAEETAALVKEGAARKLKKMLKKVVKKA